MKYNVVKKEVIANGPYSIDAENYLKYEMKRRIVLDMIDKLPFEIYDFPAGKPTISIVG